MSLLITRPEHDFTTRYLSKWSEEIIGEAEKKHIEVIDLNGEKAERPFRERLRQVTQRQRKQRRTVEFFFLLWSAIQWAT